MYICTSWSDGVGTYATAADDDDDDDDVQWLKVHLKAD